MSRQSIRSVDLALQGGGAHGAFTWGVLDRILEDERIEIVPLSDVVQTDWTIEEAMSFVMTGGANAPDKARFEKGGDPT